MLGLLFVVGLVIIWVLYFFGDSKNKDEEREFFKPKFETLKKAVIQFQELTNVETGYFSNYKLKAWDEQYKLLFSEVSSKPFDNIGLNNTELSLIKDFLKYYSNSSTLRQDFNKMFIREELLRYKNFFDNVEGRKLDYQQRVSIISDEDNNIVIAGAGSGKTTTIVGKVNYIIDRYNVFPDEILLISFTRASATTLAERINVDGIEAKTFHKLGMDIIGDVDGKKLSIYDENQFEAFLTRTFQELIEKQEYVQKVTHYFTEYLKPIKPQEEFKDQGEYFQYLKDQNFQTYQLKEIVSKGKVTYKKEVVKSAEECRIANFLLFNSVNYEYELPYEYDTATQAHRQYKPDFTINPKGRRVYLEHFGITKDGTVPPFFAKTDEGETIENATIKYKAGIGWKRELHRKHRTPLVETYSYEMADNTLFGDLSKNLSDSGVTLKPKTPEEIYEIIEDAAKEEIDNFINLFKTFITLMKSNNYKIKDVVERNLKTKDPFYKKRNELFLEIIRPVFEKYEKHLIERKETDFSDMINKASYYVANGNYKRKYKYIIIDEFQDISIGRYQLVKAIVDKNPGCKLFCVGDDWQSIYRFSGSDIALFKNFEKYFGYSIKSKIETTYRFNNPIIGLSSEFILKNPNQEKKELKGALSNRTTNYKIVYSASENQDDTLALKKVFDELIVSDPNIKEKSILILGRYSFDINRIKNEDSTFTIDKHTGSIKYRAFAKERLEIAAQFLTVHKSKGLEADIVIIINCNSGRFGFPSEMSDDPVLNLLLSEADQFENGEERRLFYVAMTRAKEKTIFIADISYKSKFIAELEIEGGERTLKKCPRCKTADLVKRTGPKAAFYGCANFAFGCDYKEWISTKANSLT